MADPPNGVQSPHESDATVCALGVPLTVVHGATRAGAWPVVEGVLMTAGLLRCEGSRCHGVHGDVVADADFDELLRVVQTGQGRLVASPGLGGEQVDWTALRRRPVPVDDSRLRAQ